MLLVCGDYASPHPAPGILSLCCDAKRKNTGQERETRDRLITAKLNQKRVNSLYICHPELVSGSYFTAQTALVLLLFR